MTAVAVALGVLIGALLSPSAVVAQAREDAGANTVDGAQDRQFVEALRREDPAGADRYVALRDARNQAAAEYQRVQVQYNATDAVLRPVFLPRVRTAERAYAEASLALLDFFEARDRRALALYQEQIGRINEVLAERTRGRAELEKMLRGR